VLVDEIVKSGKYVPDEVTNDLVRNRLLEADAPVGFLLDGYPRTPAQVEELDTMLAVHDHELDVVLELTVTSTRWWPAAEAGRDARARATTPRTSSGTGWTSTRADGAAGARLLGSRPAAAGGRLGRDRRRHRAAAGRARLAAKL
jgi:adenylate kinase family enzyme